MDENENRHLLSLQLRNTVETRRQVRAPKGTTGVWRGVVGVAWGELVSELVILKVYDLGILRLWCVFTD